MIKLRSAYYCNLKIFLLFLVIYGHLIEPKIWQSDVLMTQYRWIYLFHMPLFCFISGLFINREKDCSIQLKRMLPLYILSQAIAILFGNGTVKPLTPWWHLWYILTYCIWLGFIWIWFRFCKGKFKALILICSVLVGCLIGYISSIGREFSLSRTFVFFPYFWLGVISKPSFNWKKLRLAGIIAFVFVFILMYYVGDKIPIEFLYQATPYESINIGALYRLICYLLGGLLGLFILTVFPTKRLPFSKIGANTMPAYLLHAPIVLCLRKWDFPWQFNIIIAVAFLYITFMLTKWNGRLYGIVSDKRRDNRWQPLKKSMKNTQNLSIGSYYP